MKPPYVVSLICSAAFTVMAQNQELELMNENLNNTNVVVRRAAAKDLATNSPEKLGAEIFPVFQKALNDKDQNVRRSAAGAIHRVIAASVASQNFKLQHGVKLDLRSDSALLETATKILLDHIGDEDLEVRRSVISALATGIPITQQIEQALFNLYSTERDPRCRSVILAYFSQSKSPRAKETIMAGLNDVDGEVRGWAANAISKFTPLDVAALDRLVVCLKTETNIFAKQKIVDAIGVYEKAAVKHVPILNEIYENETNELIRASIRSSILRVDGGHAK